MEWEHYEVKRNGEKFGNIYLRIEGEETIIMQDFPIEFQFIPKHFDERKKGMLEKIRELTLKERECGEETKRLYEEISKLK